MKKKKLYGNTLKDQLIASARDRLHRFLLLDGAVRGAVVNGTRMVNEMRSNHGLGILETLVLGRTYLGAILMSSNLKGRDRLSVQFECSGQIQGITVEANAYGEVRGYLHNVAIPLEQPLEDFDLSPFFGAGFVTVTRYLEDAKQPFAGKAALKYGNIALDLAHYYLTSEQIPTAFNLSIRFDRSGEVIGAGGLMAQAMPGVGDDLLRDIEKSLLGFPSLGAALSRGEDHRELTASVFRGYSPRFLADYRVEFLCHCNKERTRSMVTMLPPPELKDILETGQFPMEIRCRHCHTPYLFSQDDIRRIYGKRYPHN